MRKSRSERSARSARSKKSAKSESTDSDYSDHNSVYDDGFDSDYDSIDEDDSSSCRKDSRRFDSDQEYASGGDCTSDGICTSEDILDSDNDNDDEYDSSSFVSETYSSPFEGYCSGQGDYSNDSVEKKGKRRNCKSSDGSTEQVF